MAPIRSIVVISCVAWAAFCGGCVSADATMLSSKRRPALAPKDVQVFLNEAEIRQPYEKVALIHLGGDANWTNEKQLYAAAKKKAARLGANGVVLGTIDQPGAEMQVVSAAFGVPVSRKSQALAVYLQPAQ